ncbi:hypothetical protein SteCoe_6338 [Stentor coeruleus]|uniref:EF-hand domain-containing protein n=1 Tax=Stentor coeruleus TaxID=5963 RepID=A0A1R2CQC7_9CILI|nr:hypothetical protein SteCoe_6338 [Stentor coeruleus]
MNNRLFEENQSKFKTIFSKIANKDGTLPLANFQLFCKNINILPTLISPVDLKRHLDKLVKLPSSRATLNFNQFEGILKDICFSCFLSAVPNERVGLFFEHINELCKSLYKVPLSWSSKKRNMSNDFSGKTEESNSSLDLDFTIKEALETLRTKDESFRSTHSALGREISPIPPGKSRVELGSSNLRTSSSTSSLHKGPYSNNSVPDSPNTSILGARPSSRYHTSQGSSLKYAKNSSGSMSMTAKVKKISKISQSTMKDSELDEFLQTEKLVESEVATVKVTLQSNSATRSSSNMLRVASQGKKSLGLRKNDYTRTKPDLKENKVSLVNSRGINSENTARKNVVVRLESGVKNDLTSRISSSVSKKPLCLYAVNDGKKFMQEPSPRKTKKPRDDLLQRHREYICKQRESMFSRKIIMQFAFAYWKNLWMQKKIIASR